MTEPTVVKLVSRTIKMCKHTKLKFWIISCFLFLASATATSFCPDSPCMDNAFIITQENSTVGQSSEYICLANHSFSDGAVYKNISCTGGTPDWEPLMDNCSVVACNIPCVSNGTIIIDTYEDSNNTWETGSVVGGSTLTYLCDNNYNFNSDETIMKDFTCMYNVTYDPVLNRTADWDISPTTELCQPVKCGEPPCANNNTIILEYCDDVVNNCTAEYVCKAGYAYSDLTISREIRCENVSWVNSKRVGNWSDLTEECQPVTCGDPPCVNHSIVITPGNQKDDVATATCQTNYIFEDGTNTRNSTCQIKSHNNGSVYGEWTPINGTCAPLDCGEPPCVNNNTLGILFDETLVGHEGRYLCDAGYSFPSDIILKNLTCESSYDSTAGVYNASWSWNATYEGECQLLQCDIPSDVENATIVATENNYTIGSGITYQCDGDLMTFNLTKEVNSTCNFYGGLTRNFSVPEFTKCYDVSCKNPTCVNNTMAVLVDTFAPEGTAKYVCDRGYAFNISGTLSLTANVTCNFDNSGPVPVSTWSAFDQHCEKLKCSEPPMIENATFVATSDDYEVGTNFTYTCKEGHYLPDLNQTMNTSCEHVEGLITNYTEMPHPACIEMSCGEPYCMNNTELLIMDGKQPGDNTSYVCKDGHAVNINGTRKHIIETMCKIEMEPTPYMHWLPLEASCEPLACDNITEIEGLTYDFPNGTNHYVGNKVMISCADNTSLFENYQNMYMLTCIEENLQPRWNGTFNFSMCYETDCGPPPTPMYADLTTTDIGNTTEGATLDYQCKAGFALNSTGDSKEYRYNRTCVKTDPTSNLPGPVHWEEASQHCEALSCGNPGCRLNTIIITETNTMDDNASLLCTEGSQYSDKSYEKIIMCNLTETETTRSVTWTNITDTCKPLECVDPTTMTFVDNLTRVDHTDIVVDSVLIVECASGYIMKDMGVYRKNISCLINETQDAVWEGLQNITCVPLSCNSSFVSNYDTAPMSANVTDTVAVDGTVLNISCSGGLYLDPPGTGESFKNYTCMEMSNSTDFTREIKWSPYIDGSETFSCVEVLCPVAENVTDATASSTSRAVDTTVTYTCSEGLYYPDGTVNQTITCNPEGSTQANWTALNHTSCIVFECPDPGIIENATRVPLAVTNKLEGANVTYNCNEGHVFPDDTTSVTINCTATGTTEREWTQPKYNSCIVLECPEPTSYAFTTMSSTNKSLGDMIKYTCRDGYALQDSSTEFNITCNNPQAGQRQWTPLTPTDTTCLANSCPEPPAFINATMQPNATARVQGTVLHYHCTPGKEFPPNGTSLTLTCEGSPGSVAWVWNTSQEYKECFDPEELDKTCPVPEPTFTNALRIPTDVPAGSLLSTEVVYKCINGYKLPDMTNETKITCKPGGNWSALAHSRCDVYCPPALMVQNATNLTDASVRIQGSVIRYRCNSNHVFPDDTDNVNITCLSGVWNWGTKAVNSGCLVLNCPDPPTLGNATLVSSSSDRSLGANLTYQCDNGYMFSDNKNSTTTYVSCKADVPGLRTWSTDYTACFDATVLSQSCAMPPDIDNATRLTNVSSTSPVDTTVEYRCVDGMHVSPGMTTFTFRCSPMGSSLTWIGSSNYNCSDIPTTTADMITTTSAAPTDGTTTTTEDPTTTTPVLTTSRYETTDNLVVCKGRTAMMDCGVGGTVTAAGQGKVIGIQWVLYGRIASYIQCEPQTFDELQFCADTGVSKNVINDTCAGKDRCEINYNTTVLQITSQMRVDNFNLYKLMESFSVPVGCQDADKYIEIAYTCVDKGAPVPTLPFQASTVPMISTTVDLVTTEPPTTPIQPLSCGHADDPAYGTAVTAADFKTANYTCVEGYQFNGTQQTLFMATCNITSGQWIPVPPPCMEIPPDCTNYGTIANGKTIQHGHDHGSLLEFTCDQGFRFEFQIDAAKLNATCNKTTGTFGPEPDRCVPIPTCQEPPWREHTMLNVTRSATGVIEIGDSVTYLCETNYRFKEYDEMRTCKCNHQGQFDNLPEEGCVPKACPEPPEYPGMTKEVHGTAVGSYVTYTCSTPGYRLYAGDTFVNILCLSTERWQKLEDSCRESRCTNAPSINNAKAKYGNITANEGGTTEFECIDGWHMKGTDPPRRNKIFVCQGGQWTGAAQAQCVLDSCGPIRKPEHGSLDKEDTTYDTKVTARCDDGYKFPNDRLSKWYHCGADTSNPNQAAAKWNDTDFQDCIRIECPEPDTVLFGTATDVNRNGNASSPNGTYLVDESFSVECNNGYRHKDGKQRKTNYCVTPGQWSEDLNCRVERCPNWGTINITNVTYAGETAANILSVDKGKKIFFPCKDGHSLMGEYTTYAFKYADSKKVDPYLESMDGSLFAQCVDGRDWTVSWPLNAGMQDPSCVVIFCDAVPVFPNASADTTMNSAGTTVTYFCDEGFDIDGEFSFTAKCENNAKWNVTKTNGCKRTACPKPEISSDAEHNMTYGATYYYGDAISFACKTGTWFQRGQLNETSRCSKNGTWNPEIKNCTGVTCIQPETWAELSVKFTNKYNYMSFATATCLNNFIFNMTGVQAKNQLNVSTGTCNENGLWDPPILSCIDPSTVKVVIPATEASGSDIIGTVTVSVLTCTGILVVAADIPIMMWQLKWMVSNIRGT